MFLPDSTQDELFNEIKPFVQTALDGENTCIFAYGQTGSGKTYTMEGPDSNSLYNSESKKLYPVSGILPRIAVFIQNEIERYKKQFNKEMSIEVSALEIYCEHVRDLLWKNNGNIDSQKWRYVEMKSKGQQTQCIG